LSLRSADGPSARRVLEDARAQLVEALGDCVFTTSGRTLPQVVGERLLERKLTLAAAESCTGGLLLQRLTDIAGSSAYVRGGIVAYDNRVKETLLDVPPDMIVRHGAVSEPVAAAMVDGLYARTSADVCIAITGVAGPGGGTEAKPVGTVVIAVRVPGRPLEVKTHLFPGGREMVRLQATQSALDRVRRLLG
jgi:nicotinamide-nucleotide amidase